MKKVFCLFSLMLALVLMNTSCTKPNDDTPIPVAISATNLAAGNNWNFYSIQLSTGEIVKSDNATRLTELKTAGNIGTPYITISFLSVTTTTLIFYSQYCSGNSTRYTTSNNNPIQFSVTSDGSLTLDTDNLFKYQISSLNEQELVMTPYGKTTPIYTLRK